MKTRKYVIAITIALAALLGCEEEPVYNYAPPQVTLTSPEDGAVITDSAEMTMAWQLPNLNEEIEVIRTLYYSDDTTSWQTMENTSATSYSLTEYCQQGKKYYWKVEVKNGESIVEKDGTQNIDATVVSSPMRHFFTSPQGVTELRDTSGHQFVTLTWADPENTDHIEICYQAGDEAISDPITVATGEQKKEFTGLENGVIHTFVIKAIDQYGNSSMTDTIQSMPLLPTQIHDVEFNIYNTFIVNYSDGTSATWMQENLRTTQYRTGEDIPVDRLYHNLYMQAATIHIDNESDEVYYSGSILKDNLYKNGGGRVCPSGYHISTDEDWKALERHLGIPDAELDSTNSSFEADLFDRGVGSGVAYQLMTDADWKNGKASFANYIIPFFAKPVGLMGYGDTEIQGKGKMCMFIVPTGYRSRLLHEDTDAINRYYNLYEAKFGGSIRCVKDK